MSRVYFSDLKYTRDIDDIPLYLYEFIYQTGSSNQQ